MLLCRVQLFATPWTIACQASLSMEFSRQEYWSGVPSPGDHPDPGIKPRSPALQADSLPSELQGRSYNYCRIVYAAAAKLLQSCPTLRGPLDCSPPGSAIPGIGSTQFQPNRLYHLHLLLCLMGADGPSGGGDGPGTLQGIIASSESS